MRNLDSADLKTVVDVYRAAAEQNIQERSLGNHILANHAYKRLNAAFKELRRRDSEVQGVFLALMAEEGDGVRLWAAAHALALDIGEAEGVLVKLAEKKGMIGRNAQITLEIWRDETL